MVAWKILPLLAGCVALSPAGASVTFDSVDVYTAQQIFGAGNPPAQYGPGNGTTTTFQTDQIASVADFYWGNSFENVGGHAGAAVQFTNPAEAQFIVHPTGTAGAVSNQPGLTAAIIARATYNFTVDTASTIALSFFGSAPTLGGGESELTVFRRDGPFAISYLLNNATINGSGTANFDLAAGSYSVTLSSDASPFLIDNLNRPQTRTDEQEAFLTLSINSPVAPPPPESAVPEPATWAMMVLGFGAIGAVTRRRGKGARNIMAQTA